VLAALISELPAAPEQLRAFIGPAISGPQYQVGEEVVAALKQVHLAGPGVVSAAVARSGRAESGKYQVDLVAAVRLALAQLGINDCSGGTWCTRADRRFYSHRRSSLQARSDGRPDGLSEGIVQTGRQATLVWLTA
jgi:copper oxidase (laccase) domain-containing protein